MKLAKYVFLSLAALNSYVAWGSEYLHLFEPYFGKKFSVSCGESEVEAYTATPSFAILEFTESSAYATPYVTLNSTLYSAIYLKSLDTDYAKLYEAYGGDIGGTTEIITNEIHDSVFRQTSKTKDGLIFKTTSSASEKSIDFTKNKAWVYREHHIDYNDGERSERVCTLRPI